MNDRTSKTNSGKTDAGSTSAARATVAPRIESRPGSGGADLVTGGSAPAPDFEKSLAELETIVAGLERGDLSLEESLRQFERGVSLTRVCQTALKQAEHKVEILLRTAGPLEEAQVASFDHDDGDDV